LSHETNVLGGLIHKNARVRILLLGSSNLNIINSFEVMGSVRLLGKKVNFTLLIFEMFELDKVFIVRRFCHILKKRSFIHQVLCKSSIEDAIFKPRLPLT